MGGDEMVLGGTGTLVIGNLKITIKPIGYAEEARLMRELRKRAEEAAGDLYSRCKNLLAKMTPEDRLEAVREIVRSEIQGVKLSLDAILQFRMTDPDWVAEEVYIRGKDATPGLTLEGLKAVINAYNAPEIFEQMIKIASGRLEADGPKSTHSSSS